MLSPNELKIVESSLNKCKNVQEMFDLLSQTFDLKKASPGIAVKGMFVKGIIKGIQLVNAPLK